MSNIPDGSFFKEDLIVTDTVYAPRETVMMKQAKAAGVKKVYNGMGMMLFQALIAINTYYQQYYEITHERLLTYLFQCEWGVRTFFWIA